MVIKLFIVTAAGKTEQSTENESNLLKRSEYTRLVFWQQL
jgi:hypothetical protein